MTSMPARSRTFAARRRSVSRQPDDSARQAPEADRIPSQAWLGAVCAVQADMPRAQDFPERSSAGTGADVRESAQWLAAPSRRTADALFVRRPARARLRFGS